MAAISLHDVVVRREDGSPALDNITIDIADGEFVVIVGPTGSGKSTLLRVVSGLEPPSFGDVRIDGIRANGWAPERRNFAMVMQQYGLYPHLTAYENIAFPLKTSHRFDKREIDALVQDVSHRLGLTELLHLRPSKLAGGERQRVAMARAVVRHPAALLLDEPLSNLDAHLRIEIRSGIRDIQTLLGLTTLYVTHDQAEAMALADRIAVLRNGALQQIGTPREIYNDPVNIFVGGFVGLPPMSFLPVTVDGDMLILSFGWLRLSAQKAARVTDGEYFAGLRPEEIPPRDITPGDRRYLAIPEKPPALAHPDMAAYAEEIEGPWLNTSFGFETESTVRLLHKRTRQLYVDGQRLHIFDPTTGVNLTRGVS